MIAGRANGAPGQWFAPGVLLLLFLLLASGPSFAHAALLAADPADGAVLASAPSLLTLEFNETVAPVTLRLVSPEGAALVLEPKFEGARLVATAPAGLGTGTYALAWRVISADGHPVGGTTVFSIGAPSGGAAPGAAEAVDWPVRSGIWAMRVLTYVGLFVGIGGVFFKRWIVRGATGARPYPAVLAAGLVGLALSVGFQGLDVLDRPIGDLLSADVWAEGLTASFGLFVGLGMAGCVLALLAEMGRALGRTLSVAALLCVGLALALTGHASTADPQWLTRPAVFAHTIVLAYWIGALLPLIRLLHGPAEAAVGPLNRFSASIPPLLVLLVAAGIALALVQFGSASAVLTTDYGHVFVVKMVLVGGLLGVAAFNRWRLTGAVLGEAGAARRRLARSIGIELGLVVAILGVVALWRFTPPPRALLEVAAAPAISQLMTADAMAEVTVTPGRFGVAAVDISVAGPDMAPLAAKGVTIDFSNREKGIEPIEREASPGANGAWTIEAMTLPVPGTWQVEVDALVSEFKEPDFSGEIDIRP